MIFIVILVLESSWSLIQRFTWINIHTVIENICVQYCCCVFCVETNHSVIQNTIIRESKLNKKTHKTSTNLWATQETCTCTYLKQCLMVGLCEQDVLLIWDWHLGCDLFCVWIEISNGAFNGNAKMTNKSRFKNHYNFMATRQDLRQDNNFCYILIMSAWIHVNPIRDKRNSNIYMKNQ